MTFAVLGPLRGWRGDTEIDPGPPKQRAILALLLVRAGHPVPLHEIIDVLWGAEPPDTAVNVVHRHIGALRRLLEPDLPARGSSRWLIRGSGGYRLDVSPVAVDLGRFRALRSQAAYVTSPGTAAELLTEALGLWQGPVAAGLPSEIRSHPAFAAVDGERLAAVKAATENAPSADPVIAGKILDLARQTAVRHPLDEALQARLMLLLAATGHQAEALEVHQRIRVALADELGLDPGAELQAAHLRVLQQEPPAEKPEPATAPYVRPAQLPAGLAVFAGRREELARLTGTGPATLVTIGGMAGVGKTSLAVHWAHQIAARFPDGQLHIDLRGFHPDGALTAADALHTLLEALGIRPERVPATLDARSALFRSLLADRRVLVVLDNARDSEHVRPLLPGAPGCQTIVTSRHQLFDLVATHGATAVTLDPLSTADAAELLTRRLGTDRVDREPDAVTGIVECAGRLPLTLAMVSARAAMNPGFPLSSIAAELRRHRGGLDAFTGESPRSDVRAVFDWSYRILSPPAADLFRLLASHPGPDCSPVAAAVLAGVPEADLRAPLTELLRAHLITEPAPGRYGCHDLLRAYGTGLAADTSGARRRLFDHYLHSAYAAVELMFAGRTPFRPGPPVTGADPVTFDDSAGAVAWLGTELPALLATITHPGPESARHRWQLATVLQPHLDRTGRWQTQREIQTVALRAAADRHAEACAERSLGFAEGRLKNWPEADRHLQRAVEIFTAIDDPAGRAHTHRLLAFLANQRERHETALEHYRIAADLYSRAGETVGRAIVHNETGWTYILIGAFDLALGECRSAIERHREAGHPNGEAAAWDSLGYAHHHLAAYDEARVAFGHALRIYRAVSDRYLQADTLTHLGDTEHAAGRGGHALDAWRQALDILDDLGHPDAAGLRDKVHSQAH
ncbi:AfsR/SARP family transcriptional regulator [Actinoplanes derwentensis]|uniref:DNA-binding transcriptional activator of the SARP family n=1 Tax=Actinoplanes derwentensis TaxID=113562 RepID=A0A1H2B8S2_9ACTN|nr:BTAD domain-containing putative transcriptional regulator [Actinoplanes derwentensis]GID86464.1 SARP family transcriptional regulator [Actinoplanes derwentensis]SDT54665.1 DNA-binding transcriptional activator of the SARP family [Actinoplanes derwentensis]